MARRLTYVWIALAAALVIGGCTGDDDSPEAGGEPEAVPTGEPAPNPCTLVAPETLESVNPRGSEPVNTLLIGDLTFDGCTIGDVYDISFGIRVVDDGTELRDLAGTATEEPEPVDVGDEAFRSTTTTPDGRVGSVVTVARFGEHVVLVRNDSLGNSNAEVRVEEEVTEALLVELGEAVPDGYEDSALTTDVGAGCLSAEDDAVTAIVGPVQLARGGTVDGDVRCAYLAEDLRVLRVSVAEASNATELYDAAADAPTMEQTDVAGAESAVVGEGVGALDAAFRPDSGSVGYVRAYSADGAELGAGSAEVVTLLERFLGEQG